MSRAARIQKDNGERNQISVVCKGCRKRARTKRERDVNHLFSNKEFLTCIQIIERDDNHILHCCPCRNYPDKKPSERTSRRTRCEMPWKEMNRIVSNDTKNALYQKALSAMLNGPRKNKRRTEKKKAIIARRPLRSASSKFREEQSMRSPGMKKGRFQSPKGKKSGPKNTRGKQLGGLAEIPMNKMKSPISLLQKKTRFQSPPAASNANKMKSFEKENMPHQPRNTSFDVDGSLQPASNLVTDRAPLATTAAATNMNKPSGMRQPFALISGNSIANKFQQHRQRSSHPVENYPRSTVSRMDTRQYPRPTANYPPAPMLANNINTFLMMQQAIQRRLPDETRQQEDENPLSRLK